MLEKLREYNFWDGQEVPVGFLRSAYVDAIQKYYGTNLIKVILGQRRAGKSYIMRMLILRLIKERHILPENILYINMDLQPLAFIKDSKDLLEVITTYQDTLKPKGRIFIFIDEVQEIKEWEKAINSLSQDYVQKYEVFISGSNANLLSQELATYLSGRFVSFEVFPFSYEEYLSFHQLERNKRTFIDYMHIGGLPENYHLTDDEMRGNYTRSLKDSILLRDIVTRYNIRDPGLLENLSDFLTDSVGSFFSVHAITNYLNSNHKKTNSETIGNYINYLVNSYLFHECDRYDIKGRKILLNEKKYYLNDLAFKYFLSSSFDKGVGHYLENLIYIDLKRKGYSVYVGTIQNKEIDFIAEKGADRIYVQVSYLLPDKEVIDREFKNLLLIQDNYPKFVISLDDITIKNYQGIQHLQAWEFVS